MKMKCVAVVDDQRTAIQPQSTGVSVMVAANLSARGVMARQTVSTSRMNVTAPVSRFLLSIRRACSYLYNNASLYTSVYNLDII